METIKLNIPKINILTIKKPPVIYEGTTVKEEVINELKPILNDAKYGKILVKGNSVVWNQLSHISTKTSFSSVSTVRAYTGVTLQKILPINHKILVTLKSTLTDKDGVIPNIYYQTFIGDSIGTMHQKSSAITNGNTSYFFVTPDTDTRRGVGVLYNGTTTEGDTLLVENICVYDLTQMFGAGNEPTTIEEFEARKPIGVTNDYNEGEIISYQQWGENVVWNQLFIPDYEKVNCKLEGNTITRTAEGIMRIRTNNSDRLPNKLLEGHKYVASVKIKANNVGRILFGTFNSSLIGRPKYYASSDDCTKITQLSTLFTWQYSEHYGFPLIGTKDNNITSIEFTDLYVVDLTLMFGEGNEPTTIEEFERRRPRNVSNEYNEGTEINGDIEIKSVGLNQWDEEWENGTYSVITGDNVTANSQIRSANYIPVIPNCFYKTEIKSTLSALWWLFFDANKDLITGVSIEGIGKSYNGFNITNKKFKTPSSAHYAKFYATADYGSTYKNDICLHLVQDGIVSQYKPYTSATTPLPNVNLIKDADGNQLFPYGLCSAGSAYDEINGTKAIKRVGVVDMGTLDWIHRTVLSNKPFQTSSLKGLVAESSQINILCAKYTSDVVPGGANAKLDKHLYRLFTDNGTNNHVILIKDDSYTDADSFKAAMQGVLLYYELAEPIEVDIDKWKAEYKVEQGGTIQLLCDRTTITTTPLLSNTNFGDFISLTPYQLAYGIEFDITNSSPICKRIGNMTMHKTLPIHNQIKGCLLDDNGNVIEYLPENDWTTATRDGSKGQVMVEIPEHYRKFVTQENKRQVWISQYPIQGFHKVNKCYVSAYEASLQRSTLKLSSVVNTDPDFRGGNNNANWDDTYRTLCGMPVTSISRTNFRNYARNRKTDSSEWNCMTYDMLKTLYWLFVTEYATLNTQAAYNSTLTTDGFKQGGLGVGVTDIDNNVWNTYNSRNPFIPCGYTDSLGNNTGVITFTMPEEYNTTLSNTNVSRYRGIENPFGHIWLWTDGINVKISPTEENRGDGLSKVFICNDPSKFNDNNYTGYTYVGNEARTNGYAKELIFGEHGEIIPKIIGGSSSTYLCDYHYTDISSVETLRGVLFGGDAPSNYFAGFILTYSNFTPSINSTFIGSRLCFCSLNNV